MGSSAKAVYQDADPYLGSADASYPCSHRRRGTSNNFYGNKCSSENVKRVYVIRHGERLMYGPRVGLSCLTSCGEQRAEWLTKVFAAGPDQDFCQPQAIYAFSYAYSPWSNEGGYQGCQRAKQVVH